jgi:hypothetical protein
VLVFERTEEGNGLYRATHQDCFSVDTSMTTESRREAVCFAVKGSAGAEAARNRAVAPPAPVERGAPVEVNGPDADRDPEPPSALKEKDLPKADILAALPTLSPAARREILACLLELEASERAPLGALSP